MTSERTPAVLLCGLLLLSPFAVGCEADLPTDFEDLDPVVMADEARAEDWPSAPQQIVGHRISGDILSLDVSYSGGCETHVFRLIVSRTFAESFPVQTWAVLAHDDRQDPCDAIVGDTLTFDLTPLREVYAAGYGAGSAEIIVHLEGLGESIRYSF